MKIQVKEIEITRAEEKIELCGVTKKFKSFQEANLWIMSQEHTYPTIGYDKHDFKVTWENDETYEGRLDLSHPSNEYYNVRSQRVETHVKDGLEYTANPPAELRKYYEEYIDQAKNMLETLQLEIAVEDEEVIGEEIDTCVYTMTSKDFGRKFTFTATSQEEADHLAKKYDIYHSMPGEHEAVNISLDKAREYTDLHNEYVYDNCKVEVYGVKMDGLQEMIFRKWARNKKIAFNTMTSQERKEITRDWVIENFDTL